MARPKASQGSPLSFSSNYGLRRSSRISGKASTSSLGRRNTEDRPKDPQTNPDPHKKKKRKKSLSQMPPPPVPTASSLQNPSSLNCPLPAISSEKPHPKIPESRPQDGKFNFIDTPARALSTQEESSRYPSEKIREAPLLPRVQTVPLEELLKEIFPSKEELHIEELCTALQQRKTIITGGRWKASLVPPSPKDKPGIDSEVFAFVEDLSEEILAAYDKLRSKYPKLPERTTNVVKASKTNRQNHSKPDAGIRLGKKLCEKGEDPLAWSWLTIVCAMEFKKNVDLEKMLDVHVSLVFFSMRGS
ncbi:hypothetical protein L218DRAFT_176773 [Marasmius fiardii PR-910]|nr:hypothetical protein L218DRAFT_176773 [Marasmius fiardii PR-910]